MTTGVIVMTQYLLAIRRDYAVPRFTRDASHA
jgi:hypothetical protein